MSRRPLAVLAALALLGGVAAELSLSAPASAKAISPVLCASCFSSQDSQFAYPGQAFKYTIAVTGVTAPSLAVKRKFLPRGLTFQDQHNGTGVVSGTPISTPRRPGFGVYNPAITAVSTSGTPQVRAYAVFSIIVCSAQNPQPPCPTTAGLNITPSTVTFPTIPPPYSPMPIVPVTIRNTGGDAISSIVVNPVGVYSIPSNTCTSTLMPGQSCTAQVQFCPTSSGHYLNTLLVTGQDTMTGTTLQATSTLDGTAT